MKYDVEKFDGRINFNLWQVQVKDVLIQSGVHKALKERPISSEGTSNKGSSMIDEDWEDLDPRAASTIRLYLTKNVLANIHGISSAKELCSEERRLMSEGRTSTEDSTMLAFNKGRKKDSKGVVCWKCGKLGHTRPNCQGGTNQVGDGTTNSSETNIVIDKSDDL
ncbi:hypothetical protein ACS0TY_005390 [Phlomoides rotata]